MSSKDSLPNESAERPALKPIGLDKKGIKKSFRKFEQTTTRHAKKFISKRISSIKVSRGPIVLWLAAVSLIIVSIAVNFSLVDGQVAEKAKIPGGTYAEGVIGKIESINPLYASTGPEISAAKLIFSSLYNYDESGRLHADLATSMKLSDDGKSYIITIRDDAKWHDGVKLTAKDVAYTVKLMQNPDVRAKNSLRTNWQSVQVNALDERTVQIVTTPTAVFPQSLTFSILPEHIISKIAFLGLRDSEFSRAPIGSGPFKFKLMQSGLNTEDKRTLHLESNTEYYSGSPLVSRFGLHVYPKPEQLLKAVNSSEVTSAVGLTLSQAESIKNKSYSRLNIPLSSGIYLIFNNQHQVFKDTKVRQVVQSLVNPKEITANLARGSEVLDLPFLSGQVPGSQELQKPSLTKEQAIKELDRAGWVLSGGERIKGGQKLSFEVTVMKNEINENIAKQISKGLAQVGINMSVRVVDTDKVAPSFLQEMLQSRNYDAIIYELPLGADPDVFSYWHSSQIGVNGYNLANYSNQTADLALVSARDQVDQSRRAVKYIAFAKEWLKDAPAVGLYRQTLYYAVNNNASSLDKSSQLVSDYDRYSRVNGWTVATRQVLKTP